MLRQFSIPVLFAACFSASLVGVSMPAQARDHVVVNNRCDSRVRVFVRAYDSDGYANYGWWVFAAHEENQVLAQNGVKLIHDHSKHLYFYAEGIGNDIVWNDGSTSTTFEGDSYKRAMTDNTDDDNDTPIILTCKS